MRVLPRRVSVWITALSLLLAAGCAGQSLPADQGPPAGQNSSAGQNPWSSQRPSSSSNSSADPNQSSPPDCSRTVTRVDDVPATLDAAFPGVTVCFAGRDLADTEVTMNRSGAPNTPIRLLSDRATVRSIHITADHVIVEGFTVASGDGIVLNGVDLTIRHNTVHDTQWGGIICAPCENSTIESNTVRHVATAGIWISGQRITVSHNTVSGTVARDNGDADGMRFFGNGHRITDNTITDISARGYADPPHPDCFQTYDNNSLPTFDVVIASNTCRNVDAQCLIATGDQHGNSAAPTGEPSISFVGNTCASNGAQAVNLRRWPNVEIRDNKISGPNVTRGIIILDGSTGCVVIGNTTAEGRPTVDIDSSSRPGSHVEHNSPG
ncbi:MAG TPA: right-handed parallel beta-helix repeat-containing protein [Pseudonocardiaceae bacterium]|nr:right-handed parallel beta-helix repeat-containing protein [Pseudonocardiaceae bacterium]